jgi:N-terminal domain of NWD NACHT-NTPase/AAA domain
MSIQSASSGGHLWKAALDTLDSDIKSVLTDVLNQYQGNIVLSIVEEAKRKKELCLRKRWRVEFRGKTVILRDFFDKIVTWVNQFNSIVDVAIQIDQTGAALPWAGVRFLLHVAVSDRQCFESTIHGLEYVSLLIARYAAFEALYLQAGSAEVQVELEHGLTTLYTRILSFLAHGIQYFRQPTPLRVIKSIFQSSQDEAINQIAKADEEAHKLSSLVDSQVQQRMSLQVGNIHKIVETLQSPVCRLVEESKICAKKLVEADFLKVLQWLSSVPYTQHHRRHSGARLPNSSKWLFRHRLYVDWKGSSSSSILLLHGIPGSGKTHLTTAVVDTFLAEHSLNNLSAPVAYFYCGDSRFGNSWADPDELMRSILRQLAIVNKKSLKIHESVTLEYARREAEAKLDGFEMPKLGCAECAELILGILGANPAAIIVDGLDEIEERRRHDFLNALTRIRDKSASVVKIFLSSRDNSNIFAGLPDVSKLRVVETEAREDMELYVKHCVDTAISTRNLLNGLVPDNLQNELIDFLLHLAGEM